MDTLIERWRRLRDAVERAGGPTFVRPDADTMAFLRSAHDLPGWLEEILVEVGYPAAVLERRWFPPLAEIPSRLVDIDPWDRNLFVFDDGDHAIWMTFDLRDPTRIVRIDLRECPGSPRVEELTGASSLSDQLDDLCALYDVAEERLDGADDRRVLSSLGVQRLSDALGEARARTVLHAAGIERAVSVIRILESKVAFARLWTLVLGAVSVGSALGLLFRGGFLLACVWTAVCLGLTLISLGSGGSWLRLRRETKALKDADAARSAASGPFR